MAGCRGAVPDAAPVLRGALRVWPFRGDDGAGCGRRAGDGVPAGLRFSGLAGRSGVRAAAQGVRADLHRVLFAAHVRVAVLHQILAAFITGCEAAWAFFGGVFLVLVPDNASAIVAAADAVNPRFTAGWLDYGLAAAD